MAFTAIHTISHIDYLGDKPKTEFVKPALQEVLDQIGKTPQEVVDLFLVHQKNKGLLQKCTRVERGKLAKECAFEPYYVASNGNPLIGVEKNKKMYGNINPLDLQKIKDSIKEEFKNINEETLKHGLLVVGELYEYLNKNNLDLIEEDFGNLLYEYLEGNLTIEKLLENYNLDKKLVFKIKNDLLFGQEINTKNLEKKLKQLQEQAKIKGITKGIQQNSKEIQQKSTEITKQLAILGRIRQKQRKLKNEGINIDKRNKASKTWQKELQSISNRFK